MFMDAHSETCPFCAEVLYLLPDPQPAETLTAPDLDMHVALTGRTRAEVTQDVHDLLCLLAMALNRLEIYELNDLLVEHCGDFGLSPAELLSDDFG